MTKNQVQTAKLKKLCDEIVGAVNEITSEFPEVESGYLHKLEVDNLYCRLLLGIFFISTNVELKQRILNLLRDSIFH